MMLLEDAFLCVILLLVGFQFINSSRYSCYMFALLNPDMKFPW